MKKISHHARSIFEPTTRVNDLKVDLIFSRSVTFRELYNKVLFDHEAGVRRELYGDNIRDFNPNSEARKGMMATLEDEKLRKSFHLFNNGITMIVSSKQDKPDNVLGLEDIKIVNGCQTAHVIMDKCKEDIEQYGNCEVMLHIIESQEEEIIRTITHATNNQTPVHRDDLLAVSAQMHSVSKFFENQQNGKLLLELRRNEFSDNNSNKNHKLDINQSTITTSELVKAYVALWKALPHTAVRAESNTIELFEKAFEDSLFKEKCYFCAYLFDYIKKDSSFQDIKVGRYQILTIMASLLLNLKNLQDIKDLAKLKSSQQNIEINSLSKNQLKNALSAANAAFLKYKKNLTRVDYRHFYQARVLNSMWMLTSNKI